MRYFLLSIFAFFVFDTFSQRNVSGVIVEVLNEQLTAPIAGVFVEEIGTENRVISGIDGKFQKTTLNDTTLLRFSLLGFLSDTIEVTQDTVLYVVLEFKPMLSHLSVFIPPSRISIGANYDFANSMLGLSFGNGFDESLIVRIPSKFVYKINAQTNFDGDYSFGANLIWSRSSSLFFNRLLWRTTPSIGFQQYNLSSQDFFHRDVYVSSAVRTPLLSRTQLTFKAGYQTLNNFDNWGGTVGFRSELWFGHSIGFGASIGYYFDYFTYSAYIRGQIGWSLFYYQLTYDRIDNYDFFNVGLSYLFVRRKR